MHIGKTFELAAKIEAFTWAGLLVGMFLDRGLDLTHAVTWLFGRLHGAAFLVYLVVAVIAAIRLRWRWYGVLAVLAAVPPLVTWPLEVWFKRRGMLAAS